MSQGDCTFAVPEADGCGIAGLLDGAVNLKQGLPSPAGNNSVVLNNTSTQVGGFFTPSRFAPTQGQQLSDRWHAAVVNATASADWTVTPGGEFRAIGHDIPIRTENTTGNPIAVFPPVPGTEFNNCAGRITDMTVDWSAPGCAAQVTGFVNFLYSNATGDLNLTADRTLTVSFVDPAEDCAGLISPGEAASLSGSFIVSPRQTITFQ